MLPFEDLVQKSDTIAIAGHIRPDGDCIGSCLGMYNELKRRYPNKAISVYLEEVPPAFAFLAGAEEVLTDFNEMKNVDLFLALDCGSIDRLGAMENMFRSAKNTVSVDHHISNTGFAERNIVDPKASSTGEVLCGMFAIDEIPLGEAECLYLAIVHDTGVFKHSNTTRYTMECAGRLLERGVSSSKIIDDSFYKKTYLQNRLLGRCLLDSKLLSNNRLIYSVATKQMMTECGTTFSDLDGVIDQLRVTQGVEVAVLLKEEDTNLYKISMRSNGKVDVCKICVGFGGGGHKMAAGATMALSLNEIIEKIVKETKSQLDEN